MIDLITLLIGGITFLLTLGYIKSRRPRNAPPGPFVWPIIGNLRMAAGTSTFHFTVNELYKKYGPILSLQMAFYPAVILSDVRVIKKALQDHADAFSDRPLWVPVLKEFLGSGRGVILENGAAWKKRKQLILTSMRDMGLGTHTLEGKIHEEINTLINEFRAVVGTDYQFQHIFNMATANVMFSIMFGARYEYTDEEFKQLMAKLNYNMGSGLFANKLTFLPDQLLYFAPLIEPAAVTEFKNLKFIMALLQTKIEEHKSNLNKDDPRDLLDFFLMADISENDVQMTLYELTFAASETTSYTLLWVFLFMLRHPEVQERCRKEIIDVAGKDRMPSMADKEHLPFTSATLMEVQRLSSVVAMNVFHNCNRDVELDGFSIPKDTIVFINQYSVHMDPENWDQPEDFKPERFLSDDQETVLKPEAFMPFGFGRRLCLGENLAKMELFLFFTGLLQKFRFVSTNPDSLPTVKDSKFGWNVFPSAYTVVLQEV